jgi:ATP-dependent Clp protease adaptor protein ClpS
MVKSFSHSPDLLEEVALETEVASGWAVILYNDDVNTFEWVIDCLIKYCKHEALQAEQCAWIVHTKGKCLVKSGDFETLEPICTALCDNGLSATIEEVK